VDLYAQHVTQNLIFLEQEWWEIKESQSCKMN
jgi:hypothetical protein